MRPAIHPEYVECKVTCACGYAFTTRSTKAELHVEICAKCHPFYTGKQRFVDTAGRVEKFQKRHAWNDGAKDKVLAKKEKRRRKQEKVTIGGPKVKRRKEETPREGKEAGVKGSKGGGAKEAGVKGSKGGGAKEAGVKGSKGGGAKEAGVKGSKGGGDSKPAGKKDETKAKS